MIEITLYRTLGNYDEEVKAQAGRRIAEYFPDVNMDSCIVLVNGHKADGAHITQDGEHILVRRLPQAAALIIGGIIAAAAAVFVGVKMYKMKKQLAKQQEAMEKLKNQTNTAIDNRPFLRGASNTQAKDNNQPYILGRHLFTPYLLSPTFYQIEGTDGEAQYTYLTLECGFCKQVLESISVEDVRVKTFNDSTPQEGMYYFDGGNVFAPGGIIEVAQDGALLEALPTLNYRHASNVVNEEVVTDSAVNSDGKERYVFTLDAYAMDVDIAITFPNGLYRTTDKGDRRTTSVTITPQYSLDGGQTWVTFTFNQNGQSNNTFTRCEGKRELRYIAHRAFTKAETDRLHSNGQAAITCRVLSNGVNDTMVTNTCYVLYYQSLCYDPNKSGDALTPCLVIEDRERAYCTILAMRIKSSSSNEDKLKSVNVITLGVARVWDKAAHKWSEGKVPTRNAASWALEVLTSSAHEASRYNDSEVDMEAFGDLYEWCDERGYKFDYVITQKTKKSDTLSQIMEVCSAVLYTDIYGRMSVAYDRPRENAVAVYNAQNIITIENKKDFARMADGLRVKFVNSKDGLYSEDTYLVMKEGHTLGYDTIIKDVTLTGITEYEAVVKYARRLMAIEELRPKVTTITVGDEGIYLAPYEKVLVQDDSIGVGLVHTTVKYATWWGGLLRSVTLGCPVTFDDNDNGRYALAINCLKDDGASPLLLHVTGKGETDEVYVEDTIRKAGHTITSGDVCSFGLLSPDGSFDATVAPFIITGIHNGEDGGYSLELAAYDERIFDSGTIGEYSSPLSKRPKPHTQSIPQDAVTKGEVAEAIETAVSNIKIEAADSTGKEAAEVVAHGVHFTSVHKIPDMTASVDDVIHMVDEARADTMDGISVTKDAILLQITDDKKELQGLIAVQAGAVTAMVQGGGDRGQLALSLELPALIDEDAYHYFIERLGAEDVDSVYAPLVIDDKPVMLGGKRTYTILEGAGNGTILRLWERAREEGVLASQISLDARQILLNGNTICTGNLFAPAIRGDIIDANTLYAKYLSLSGGGYAMSSNWGSADSGGSGGYMQSQADGTYRIVQGDSTRKATEGFAIDSRGNADFMGYLRVGTGLKVEQGTTTLLGGIVSEGAIIQGQGRAASYYCGRVEFLCRKWSDYGIQLLDTPPARDGEAWVLSRYLGGRYFLDAPLSLMNDMLDANRRQRWAGGMPHFYVATEFALARQESTADWQADAAAYPDFPLTIEGSDLRHSVILHVAGISNRGVVINISYTESAARTYKWEYFGPNGTHTGGDGQAGYPTAPTSSNDSVCIIRTCTYSAVITSTAMFTRDVTLTLGEVSYTLRAYTTSVTGFYHTTQDIRTIAGTSQGDTGAAARWGTPSDWTYGALSRPVPQVSFANNEDMRYYTTSITNAAVDVMDSQLYRIKIAAGDNNTDELVDCARAAFHVYLAGNLVASG